MNKKRADQKKEKDLEENELVSWGEEKFEAIKPYMTQILLGALIAFMAFMAITYFIARRGEAAAQQWRQLNNSMVDHRISGNSDRLRDVHDLHPDGRAGFWALQMAGDYDLQTGLGQLAEDRVNGMKTIKKAKETLEKVVDGNDITDMLAQRSRFSLAYACESLGDFSEAKEHFQILIDKFPESAFADAAKRALVRVGDPKFSEAFTSFTEWEDAGVAPGPAGGLPDAPEIDFGAFDGVDTPVTQPNLGGGDLDTGDGETPMKKDEAPAEGSEGKLEMESKEAPAGSLEKDSQPVESKEGTESPIEGSLKKIVDEDDLPPTPKSGDK